MTPDGLLAGKVAIVTGGMSGSVGPGDPFAGEGRSAAHVPTGGGGQRWSTRTALGGGEAIFVRADVREPGDVESLVEAAEERFGRVDVLYASAGVMLTGTAPETDEEVYRTMMDVNVGGTFRLVKYGSQRSSGPAAVDVLTASELGLVGASEAVVYCASKGAVINMARALGDRLRLIRIRGTACAPGHRTRRCCGTGSMRVTIRPSSSGVRPEPKG